MIKGLFRFVALGIVVFSFSGCANIPSEAPTLSSELGKRIESLEEANIRLLNRFFEQKRKDIDTFIEHEWLPTFSNEFFRRPQIANAWNTVVRENDNKQRTKFLMKVGTSLQETINQKRLELIRPLDELERQIEHSLKNEYAQAKAINNSVTSFLLSASKVAENRDRLLAKAGVTEEEISKVIDKTDEIVTKLLDGAKTVDEKSAIAEEYVGKIRELKNSL